MRNHPPDLINVALERIIEASLELPAYSTLDNMATTVRAEVNYLADPQLRARITAATNKVESHNGFSHWLAFGNNGVLANNDPVEQEKLIKLNTLLANLVIFHNALDIMDVVRRLAAEGLAHHRRPARRDVALPAWPHQPVRRLRHRRPQTLARGLHRCGAGAGPSSGRTRTGRMTAVRPSEWPAGGRPQRRQRPRAVPARRRDDRPAARRSRCELRRWVW